MGNNIMPRIIIFDTETTGLPKLKRLSAMDSKDNWPDIVSICWRVFEDTKEISNNYYIIRPEGWVIPEDSFKIHKISQERAMKEGASLNDVLMKFKNDITSSDMIIAHNLEFDKNVILNAYLWRLHMPIEFWFSIKEFCTADMSKNVLKLPGRFPNSKDPYKIPSLNELYVDTFKEAAPPDAHSAERDVDVLQKIVWKRWNLF